MRRSFSLAMGLVLILAMLGVQASVSVLAQGTPVATPGAGASPAAGKGVQIDYYAHSDNVGANGQQQLVLANITMQPDAVLPGLDYLLPSAVFEVETGVIAVEVQKSEGDVWVSPGKGGEIKTDKGALLCESNGPDCRIQPGETVILGPGNSISLKLSTFIITAPQDQSGIKTFQPSGSASVRGAVLQPMSACWICPRPY